MSVTMTVLDLDLTYFYPYKVGTRVTQFFSGSRCVL